MEAAAVSDRAAIAAFGETLKGTGKPLLIASGTLGLAPGRVGTEEDHPAEGMHPRILAAKQALALADDGVRAIVVRLPPTVHGKGDHGFMSVIVATARQTGVSGYVGEGENRWSAVHRVDAARVFRLGLESAPAGAILHAVADEGVATRTIAETIGRGLDLPLTSVEPGALRLAGHVLRRRRTRLEHDHARTARLGAGATRADRRPRSRVVLLVEAGEQPRVLAHPVCARVVVEREPERDGARGRGQRHVRVSGTGHRRE